MVAREAERPPERAETRSKCAAKQRGGALTPLLVGARHEAAPNMASCVASSPHDPPAGTKCTPPCMDHVCHGVWVMFRRPGKGASTASVSMGPTIHTDGTAPLFPPSSTLAMLIHDMSARRLLRRWDPLRGPPWAMRSHADSHVVLVKSRHGSFR